MRRSIWILSLLLAVLAIYLITSRHSGTYRPSIHDFSIEDTSGIRFVRVSHGTDTLLLENRNRGWQVNHTWSVRRAPLQGLLVLLSRLEVRSPVSNQENERVLEMLERGKHVLVGLHTGKSKAYQIVFDAETDATYMLLSGSEQPFMMQVRGYDRRNLEEVFDLDAAYWRDHTLFRYLPGDILFFSLEDHRNPENSFQLKRQMNSNEFLISRPGSTTNWQQPDPEHLRQFLSYMGPVRYEQYHDPLDTARTVHHDPRHTLRLIDTDSIETKLVLYPALLSAGGGDSLFDPHYLFGRLNDEPELLLLKYLEIDLLLKDYGYFFGD